MAGPSLTPASRLVGVASFAALMLLGVLVPSGVAAAESRAAAPAHRAAPGAPVAAQPPEPEHDATSPGQERLRDLVWLVSAGLALAAGLDTLRRRGRRSVSTHPSRFPGHLGGRRAA
jgi:Tfp pilus assembly protein FimV